MGSRTVPVPQPQQLLTNIELNFSIHLLEFPKTIGSLIYLPDGAITPEDGGSTFSLSLNMWALCVRLRNPSTKSDYILNRDRSVMQITVMPLLV
jgi:hypothetical protein